MGNCVVVVENFETNFEDSILKWNISFCYEIKKKLDNICNVFYSVYSRTFTATKLL